MASSSSVLPTTTTTTAPMTMPPAAAATLASSSSGPAPSSPAHSLASHASSAPSLATPTEFLQNVSGSLTSSETESAEQFLSIVNGWRSARGYDALSHASAVKFLMARKFHVDRALSLYQQHELMRLREGLHQVDPHDDPQLRGELQTGKFSILPGRDYNGATLALFNAQKHEPSTSDHRTTLQGVVYQLDVAMEAVETQRGGLVFIYNMAGSKYSNFDYDLSQKMLTLLKGAYPARLKKVLIVTAPLWFKAPFRVLRLFVREKLRDRVFTVSIPQLQMHVPQESIPRLLGGQLDHDHQGWLSHCEEIVLKKELVTMTLTSASNPTTPAEQKRKQPTAEQLRSMPVSAMLGRNSASNQNGTDGEAMPADGEKAPPPPAPPAEDEDSLAVTGVGVNGLLADAAAADDSNGFEKADDSAAAAARVAATAAAEAGLLSSTSSGLSEDEAEKNLPSGATGMTLAEFVEHVRAKGRRGLYDEYTEIKNRQPTGTFNHSRAYENQVKNRYTDVLCYDHSRVILQNDGDGDGGGGVGDYINANYVDGYQQPRAFISSQGPLPKTFADFWQMVWEQQVVVIVMTTKTVERHRNKCGQYWPEDCGGSLVAGPYEIHSEEMENSEDFVVTHLTLRHLATGALRKVCHFQFVSWPDYGVPESALSMLHFLQRVREKQAELTASQLGDAWALGGGHPLGPPMVVHCSAGIGRTGTFATLDIAIRKFEDIGRVDVRSTVEKIRSQRAFSIQMPDQYVFCHLAFLEYVLNMEYVDEIDLTGFDDDCDSE